MVVVVVELEAPRRHAARPGRVEWDKSRLPPDGQARRGFNDALRVLPEGNVEHGRFTDGTIDQVGQSPLDVASRGHID